MVTSKRKKILFISHSSHIGGAEKTLMNLTGGLDRKRFTPVVVVPGDGWLKAKLDELDIKNYMEPTKWWIYHGQARETYQRGLSERCGRLTSLIEDEKIDVVHTNTSTVAEGAIAARMTNRPHVWHLHEILEGHPSLCTSLPLYLTYKFIDLLSDVVVAVSQSHRKALSMWINPDKIRVIYNGVESSEADGPQNSIRHELNISEDSLLVCTVGHIVKEKGYDTFIDSARKLIEKTKKIHFLSVGEKADIGLWESIQNKIKEFSLEDNVTFLGNRNDVGRILKAIDIYVVSSLMETFGMAAVEAMAAGKPVISTRCGGPEEIIADGETGILVPSKDPDAIAAAIASLANDPEKRKQMGLNGRKRFENLFTMDEYVGRFERLYPELKNKIKLGEEDNLFAEALIELLSFVNPQIEHKDRLIERKDEVISDLLNSASWRVTAPLRKAARIVKKEKE